MHQINHLDSSKLTRCPRFDLPPRRETLQDNVLFQKLKVHQRYQLAAKGRSSDRETFQ